MNTGDSSDFARSPKAAPLNVRVLIAAISNSWSPHEHSRTTVGKKSPSKKRVFNTVSFKGGGFVFTSERTAEESGNNCGSREPSSRSQRGYSEVGMATRGSVGEIGSATYLHNLRNRSCSVSVGDGRGDDALKRKLGLRVLSTKGVSFTLSSLNPKLNPQTRFGLIKHLGSKMPSHFRSPSSVFDVGFNGSSATIGGGAEVAAKGGGAFLKRRKVA